LSEPAIIWRLRIYGWGGHRRRTFDQVKLIRECVKQLQDLLNDEPTWEAIASYFPVQIDQAFSRNSLRVLHDATDRALHPQKCSRPLRLLDDDSPAAFAIERGNPFHVVVDPARAFGRPIVAEGGVPVEVLADAVEIEGCEPMVARSCMLGDVRSELPAGHC
jgi:hypothetical protein